MQVQRGTKNLRPTDFKDPSADMEEPPATLPYSSLNRNCQAETCGFKLVTNIFNHQLHGIQYPYGRYGQFISQLTIEGLLNFT